VGYPETEKARTSILLPPTGTMKAGLKETIHGKSVSGKNHSPKGQEEKTLGDIAQTKTVGVRRGVSKNTRTGPQI